MFSYCVKLVKSGDWGDLTVFYFLFINKFSFGSHHPLFLALPKRQVLLIVLNQCGFTGGIRPRNNDQR